MYLETLLTVWFILWLFRFVVWLYVTFQPNVVDPEILKKYVPKSFKETIDENNKLREDIKK